MALVGETAGQGDRGQGLVGARHDFVGQLQAALAEIATHRAAESALERPRQMAAMDSRLPGEVDQ